MSSVSPSSSASQHSAESSVTSAVVGIDVKGSMEVVERMCRDGLLTPSQSAGLMRQILGGYHSYVRKLGGTSSSVASGASSGAVGWRKGHSKAGSGCSGDKFLRMQANWRLKPAEPELEKPADRSDAAGYCYLRVLVPEHRERLEKQLGSGPSIRSLMALRRSEVVPDEVLQGLAYSLAGQTVHVYEDVKGGFLQEMQRVAVGCRPAVVDAGTWWSALVKDSDGIQSNFDAVYSVGQVADSCIIRLVCSSRDGGAAGTWQDEVRAATDEVHFPFMHSRRGGPHELEAAVQLKVSGASEPGACSYLTAALGLGHGLESAVTVEDGVVSVPAGTLLRDLEDMFYRLKESGIDNCADHWAQFRMPDIGPDVPVFPHLRRAMLSVNASAYGSSSYVKPHMRRLAGTAYEMGLIVGIVHSRTGVDFVVAEGDGDEAEVRATFAQFLVQEGYEFVADDRVVPSDELRCELAGYDVVAEESKKYAVAQDVGVVEGVLKEDAFVNELAAVCYVSEFSALDVQSVEVPVRSSEMVSRVVRAVTCDVIVVLVDGHVRAFVPAPLQVTGEEVLEILSSRVDWQTRMLQGFLPPASAGELNIARAERVSSWKRWKSLPRSSAAGVPSKKLNDFLLWIEQKYR